MINKNPALTQKFETVCIESLVPQNHILRKIDRAFSFNFIYDYIEDMYSSTGRPSIDPVVLIKIAFLCRLDNHNSIRATFRELEVNVAYRWFCGFGLEDKIPHFSDYSRNYLTRFSKTIDIKDDNGHVIKQCTLFEIIFEEILMQAYQKGFLKISTIYEDSTHVKANANKKKVEKKIVAEEAKSYQDKLDREIDQYCIEKDLKTPKEIQLGEREVKKSTTDPECGIFNKGEHEVQAAYLAQTVCDDNGFVLATKVNPANLHDSTTFSDPFESVVNTFGAGEGKIESIAIDAGFKTPAVLKEISDKGITPLVPYTSPKGRKHNEDNPVKMAKKDFKYDENKDVFYCPNGVEMTPRGVDRKNGYITYRAKSSACQQCPFKHQCLSKTQKSKTVIRHVWSGYMKLAELVRHTHYHKVHYARRKETIERVFADAKEKHGARFTRLRGLKKVQDEMYLIFACMNLKKMAIWMAK